MDTASDYYPQGIAFVPECFQFTPPSAEAPPLMDRVYDPSTSSPLPSSPAPILPLIRAEFRSVPNPGSSLSVLPVVPELTAPLPSAFHTGARFRYIPPEVLVLSAPDRVTAVERELLALINAGRDCDLDISTSLPGLLHHAAGGMKDSPRLSRTESQTTGLTSALDALVTAMKSNDPASFVQEASS